MHALHLVQNKRIFVGIIAPVHARAVTADRVTGSGSVLVGGILSQIFILGTMATPRSLRYTTWNLHYSKYNAQISSYSLIA